MTPTLALPRVVVRVSTRDSGGWAVETCDWDNAAAVVPQYQVDAADITVGGVDLRVPVVPACRRPPEQAPHHRLCVGDADAATRLLDRLSTGDAEPDDVLVYGRWLFECLLAPAWPAIRADRAVTEARGVELALEWPVEDTDLHRLVWEAMHDGSAPLAGHRELLAVITRLVPVETEPPVTVTRMPRVLFATGSALTDAVIRPGAMFMGLLRAFESEGICASRAVQDVTAEDLAEECARFRPDVVHLVAHGTVAADGTGVLQLGAQRAGTGTDGRALATALAAGGRPLAVALSACQSGIASGPNGAAPLAAELVRAGVPIVSAMAGEISEQACRLYSRRLVQAIHDGEPVVAAAAKGRRAALLHAENPSGQLDWAMPALFLARSVPPAFRPVDPTPARSLVEVADELGLRQQPVFIGRHNFLDLADDLFSPDPSRRLGFVGIVKEGTVAGLGGTRLLREIGFRLLRAGHVPLLLGPYSHRAPADLRAVVVGIVERAAKVAELLRLPPAPATVLGADGTFPRVAASVAAPTAVGFAGLPADEAHGVPLAALAGFVGRSRSLEPAQVPVPSADEAHEALLAALAGFGRRRGPLDPAQVRLRLVRDLARLAEAVGAAGEPFGPHTRVVVLADEVHAWAGALGPLLDVVGRNGLGTAQRPVPVVATASLVEGAGPALRAFRDDRVGMPGYAFPELTRMPLPEAALGFQWVLLHPWHRDRGPEYRRVYTAARNACHADVHAALDLLEGRPTAVDDMLYFTAQLLLRLRHFVDADDNQAYAEYVGRYG